MNVPEGTGIVLQPEEGQAYWQPIWANGYSIVKLSPKHGGPDDLAMGGHRNRSLYHRHRYLGSGAHRRIYHHKSHSPISRSRNRRGNNREWNHPILRAQ